MSDDAKCCAMKTAIRYNIISYSSAKNATDAAAITEVAAQPQRFMAGVSVNRPITRELLANIIITTINGAASTPLTTAAQ